MFYSSCINILVFLLIMNRNNYFVTAEKSYLRLRNSLLRVYIANDKKYILNEYGNKISKKTNNMIHNCYQILVSKYHDINLQYYTLTEEEKELIEFIISLCY